MDRLWRGALIVSIVFVNLVQPLPIDDLATTQVRWQWNIGVGTLIGSICLIVAVAGCLCCQHRKGFQVFTNAPGSTVIENVDSRRDLSAAQNNDVVVTVDPGVVNPLSNIASPEFTIFQPLSPLHHNNNVLNLPLRASAKRTPEAEIDDTYDVTHWFDDSEANFPRHKLKYLRELGRGWFGRVIIGEALISNGDNEEVLPVVVRMLNADAAPHQRVQFLRDAQIYANHLSHSNILKLHGRCLEISPYLLIHEFCPKGDLKKYLRENNQEISDKIILRFASEICDALQYLHQKEISHPDLATRNCQLSDNLHVLLGDYGLAVQSYPEDYYEGTPPVPVRWCAPENVTCTPTTIQPKHATCRSNIWSLGVTIWELITFGEQPYKDLSNDDVVTFVLEQRQAVLSKPEPQLLCAQNLYQLSRLCCSEKEIRPQIAQVKSMISVIMQSNQWSPSHPQQVISEPDFLLRWNNLKPNTIVKTDNHTPLQIEINANSPSDQNSMANVTVHYDARQLSPASTVNSDSYVSDSRQIKSPSLTNLHGSLENLVVLEKDDNKNPVSTNPFTKVAHNSPEYESWLASVANENKEDLTYVEGLSQAMNELDNALAMESSGSSDTSHQPSPETWPIDQVKSDHPKINFKLGPISTKTFEKYENMSQPESLLDSILVQRSNSGSETEDETWRKRIERGAYSEKVRIKSKSVADLMVLTHIDTDTDSAETPLTSLEYKPKSLTKTFGSEGNLNSVKSQFEEELKKLQEARRDSLLFVPIATDHLESQTTNSNSSISNIPSLNVISVSSEDLTTIKDLDIPLHVFLSKKPDEDSQSIEDHTLEDEDVPSCESPIPSFNIIGASCEDLSTLQDLDIPVKIFLERKEKIEAKNDITSEMESKTLDLVQTVSNLTDLTTTCAIPSQPQEFNVMRFEIVPNYNFEASNVILGPCADCTIDLYSGLKTTFGKEEHFDDEIDEDELLHFSTNFTQLNLEIQNGETLATDQTIPEIPEEFAPSLTPPSLPNHLPTNLSNGLQFSSVINTPCDSLEEHALNTTNELKHEAENLVFDIITSAECFVNSQLKDTSLSTSIDLLPVAKKFVTSLISDAEEYVNKCEIPRLAELETPQFDSLENNINSTDSCNTMICKNLESNQDLKCDTLNGSNETFDENDFKSPKSQGWYLHVKDLPHEISVDTNVNDQVEDELESPGSENSYVGIRLDEECMEALRSELIAKLPLAQNRQEPSVEPEPEENWITDTVSSEIHDEGVLYYNVFAARLSPIAEESEDFEFPTPEITQCRDDSDSDYDCCEGCCEGDIRVVHSGGRRSSRHRHTPSTDSCCSNDTLFNIEDLNGATVDSSDVVHKTYFEHLDFNSGKVHDESKESLNTPTSETLTTVIGDDKCHGQLVSDVGCNNNNNHKNSDIESTSDKRLSLESEIADETYTMTDILTHLEDASPDPNFDEHVTITNGEFFNVNFAFNEPSSVSVVLDDASINELLSQDVLDLHNEHTKQLIHSDESFRCQKLEQNQCNSQINENETVNHHDLNSIDFNEDRMDASDNLISASNNLDSSENIYVVSNKSNELITDLDDYTKHLGNIDDESVKKLYENIPTSLVHDDKIIESIYENIGKVGDREHFDKFFNSLDDGTSEKSESTIGPNITYDKLYENIGNAADYNRYDTVDDDDTYDKVYTTSDDLYSDITDIRFSGPVDAQLMSTSFSDAVGGSDDQDWDSGSESHSSSSGEFVWKEGEHEASVHVLQAPAEEDYLSKKKSDHGFCTPDEENSSTTSGEEDDEGVEFVPSAWDSQALPLKSALRSPDKKIEDNSNERKMRNVCFKKQKYHCVYEYPREPDITEISPQEWTPVTPGNGLWCTPTEADLSSFAEWELDTENVVEDDMNHLIGEEVEDDLSSRYTRRDYYRRPGDLYRLANVAPDIDFTAGSSVTDDDFYITSSSRPFQSVSQYELGCQFFPGQIQFTPTNVLHGNNTKSAERAHSILDFANDLKKLHSAKLNSSRIGDQITPDSGVEDITPAGGSEEIYIPLNSKSNQTVASLRTLANNAIIEAKLNRNAIKNKDTIVMGGLRHTRDRLKLDLPPSPNSFTANKVFNLEMNDSKVQGERDIPAFTTFGKTRFSIKHVDTPTEDGNDLLANRTPMMVDLNSSSTESASNETNSPDAVDLSQPSEFDSVADSLIESSDRRSIEIVRGEASLLDSADEDSGIESSTNATLERGEAIVLTVCNDNKV